MTGQTERVEAALSRRRRWRIVLVLCVAASISRGALVATRPLPQLQEISTSGEGDSRYYARLAQHLLAFGEYAEGHLRAYRPPGYPVFLAGMLWLGLKPVHIQLVQNVFYLVALAILMLWAWRLGGTGTALVAGLLGLCTFAWALLPQKLLSETLFLLLVILGVEKGLAKRELPTLGSALTTGVVFGVAALVRETGMVLGILAAGLIGWRLRGVPKNDGSTMAALACVAGMACTVLPWSLRNYRVLGAAVPISTNGPINLYMGNNPVANGGYSWALPAAAQAVWNRPDAGQSNEVFAMRLAGAEARAYILAHPIRTLAIIPRKLWALWGPPLEVRGGLSIDGLARVGVTVLWFATFVCGLIGTWHLRREPIGQFLMGAVLLATAIHALTYGGARYRSAYEFILILPTALVLRQRGAALRRRFHPD